MSLLDLVEEHYGIGLAPYSLGQLSTLVISHVSRRRTDESRHTVFLLILAHVDTSHHRLVVEEVFGESLGKLRLTHTGGAEENERGYRSLGILKTGTTTAHSIADSLNSLVLTNDTLVQLLFEMKQFLALALHHSCHGDSRPSAHHLGDVVGSNLLAHHHVGSLLRVELLLNGCDVGFERLYLAIAYLGYSSIVALALGTLCLNLEILNLLLVLLNLVDESALALPLRSKLAFLVAQFGYLLVELGKLVGVVLTLDGLALYLQLLESA